MINWAYIAGCIDCDGWITKSTRKNALYSKTVYTIGITQHLKRKDKMKLINNFLNNNGIHTSFIERKGIGNLGQIEMVNIMIKKQDSLIKLINYIFKYLLFKQEKALECLNYLQVLQLKRIPQKNYKNIKFKKRYWTKNELKQLKSLIQKGYTNTTIAIFLNRSSCSISSKICKIKLSRWQQKDMEEINERNNSRK